MLYRRLCALWLFAATTAAQHAYIASNTTTFEPKSDFPYFNVTPTGDVVFPLFQIVPLGEYAHMSRQRFQVLRLRTRLLQVTPDNVNNLKVQDVAYVSCDPQDYSTSSVADLVKNISDTWNRSVAIVLYTRNANVCYTSISNLPPTNGIFSTVDPLVAAMVVNTLNASATSDAVASIEPDTNTFTNSHNDSGPTTAVAMIILYSITAIITGLFVVIILTGAIRAHRHPERYGPRSPGGGRGRQSRAKGIARAMLETLPIVKFGDQQGKVDKEASGGIEMPATVSAKEVEEKGRPQVTATAVSNLTPLTSSPSSSSTILKESTNADGSDEAGSLGCSICTEDFQKGEEVRVLPCNHKFHPECVDPWLLNVSGTCPLCRIDLRTGREAPAEESLPRQEEEVAATSPTSTSPTNSLRAALSGSREDRIAALRRFRHDRRDRNSTVTGPNNEEERRTVASRLRERFRIRTRQHGTEGSADDEEQAQRRESDTARRSRSGSTFFQPR